MSCVPDRASFRLLDALVGWDPDSVEGLRGENDLDGISLAALGRQTSLTNISRALPPAWLAFAGDPCQPRCDWYLASCCPPRSRLLRLNPCYPDWRPAWQGGCDPALLDCAVAIAVNRDQIAVADAGRGRVTVWRRHGSQLAWEVSVNRPGPIAWMPHCDAGGGHRAGKGHWLVVDEDNGTLRRFDLSGRDHPQQSIELPATAERIGVDGNGHIWLVAREEDGYAIWVARKATGHFQPADIEALLAAFPDSGLRQWSRHTFCLHDRDEQGARVRCYDCHGRPVERPAKPPTPPLYEPQGQLLTLALDSGMPRCRWHRVRIDADIPPATEVTLAVSSHEAPQPPSQGQITEPRWQGFAAGLPHPDDWHEGPVNSRDFLIDQPPGRYLFVRLRLRGDGSATPRVRRIRLDFPRQTSLNELPSVYREDPRAEDFSERFLALFDAAIEDIDRAIERQPALLDSQAVPAEVLPWLGGFLDVVMDPAWSETQRRRILQAVPELYPRRGTPEGLRRTLALLLEVEPLIDETALARMWGAVDHASLGGVRLFSRAGSRWRLGRSPLSGAPLRSYGNPDRDPIDSHAHRFRVALPAGTTRLQRQQAEQLIATQKPAHTVASLVAGGSGMVVGIGMQIGIDTALTGLPVVTLGGDPDQSRPDGGGLRLNHNAIVQAGHLGHEPALRLDRTTAIGINTLME